MLQIVHNRIPVTHLPSPADKSIWETTFQKWNVRVQKRGEWRIFLYKFLEFISAETISFQRYKITKLQLVYGSCWIIKNILSTSWTSWAQGWPFVLVLWVSHSLVLFCRQFTVTRVLYCNIHSSNLVKLLYRSDWLVNSL